MLDDEPIDIARIDAALSKEPAAHETLVELARQIDADAIAEALRSNQARDLRWRLALRGALHAASRFQKAPVSSASRLGAAAHLDQIVRVRGGYLYLSRERGAEQAELVRVDRNFAVVAKRMLEGFGHAEIAVLPQPLREENDGVLVCYVRGAPHRACFVFDEGLRVVSRADVTLPNHRAEVRYCDLLNDELVIEGAHGMFWAPLHDADDVIEFPTDESFAPPRRFVDECYFGFVRRLPVWVDGWLTFAGGPELVKGSGWVSNVLRWVHLDRDVLWTTDNWPRSATGWAVHRNALWIASDEGLHRSEPGGDVELVHETKRSYYGMASGSEGLIVSTRNREWVTTDHEGRARERGELLADTSFATTRALADGLLVGNQPWMWIGSEGVRASSVEGGALTTPDDRHVVSGFVSGASGYVVDGTSLVRVDLPSDATVEASWGEHIIVRTGKTRYLVGREGMSRLEQEELAVPKRTHYGGGPKGDGGLVEDERILMMRGGAEMWQWQPTELGFAWTAPPSPRRVANETREGCEKRNPRDDWVEPGLMADGEVVHASGCRYGGDYGAPGEAHAVVARRGAIVTLEDCSLVRGGLLVEGYSTVYAVRCELSRGRYVVRPGSHLVLVDCALPSDAILVGTVHLGS